MGAQLLHIVACGVLVWFAIRENWWWCWRHCVSPNLRRARQAERDSLQLSGQGQIYREKDGTSEKVMLKHWTSVRSQDDVDGM